MIDKKNKIITLKSGTKYTILEQCLYKEMPYYFACKINNNQVTDEFKIITIYKKEDKELIKIINDDNLIKEICTFMDKNTQ